MREFGQQAGLRIIIEPRMVFIRHKLNLKDKSIWGLLVILGGGVFLVLVVFLKNSDVTTKILGVLIGFFMSILATLTIIRDLTDYVKIKGEKVYFRYNLRSHSIPVEKSMRIVMKTEVREISRIGVPSSAFIHITHFLQTPDNEIPILFFQMDSSESEEAKKLGVRIAENLNTAIRNRYRI